MGKVDGGYPQPCSAHNSKTPTARAHGRAGSDHPGALAVFAIEAFLSVRVKA